MTMVIETATTVDARDAARALLVAAFVTDPFYVWLEPDPVRRPATASAMLSFALASTTVRVAREGARVSGVVAFHDPDVEPTGGSRDASGVLRAVARRPGRTLAAGRVYAAILARRPRRAVVVELLAVDAAERGRGLARGLLEPLLASAAARGLPTHLETTRPENLAFYGRFGFAETAAPVVVGDSPPTYTLARPAVPS